MTSCSFSTRTFPSQVATTLHLHFCLLKNVVLSKSVGDKISYIGLLSAQISVDSS